MVNEDDLAASAFDLLTQEHLVDIFAGEAIRGGDQDAVEGAVGNLIPEPIESRSRQGGATVAVISKNVPLVPGPALAVAIVAETVKLLVDGLGLDLLEGRDPDIACNSHYGPPVGSARVEVVGWS
jgi:hypothetical protein